MILFHDKKNSPYDANTMFYCLSTADASHEDTLLDLLDSGTFHATPLLKKEGEWKDLSKSKEGRDGLKTLSHTECIFQFYSVGTGTSFHFKPHGHSC